MAELLPNEEEAGDTEEVHDEIRDCFGMWPTSSGPPGRRSPNG